MIRLLESICVGQFTKKISLNRSVAFPVAVNQLRSQFSAESVRLSSSLVLVLILKRITIVKWYKQSSINTILIKFLFYSRASARVKSAFF